MRPDNFLVSRQTRMLRFASRLTNHRIAIVIFPARIPLAECRDSHCSFANPGGNGSISGAMMRLRSRIIVSALCFRPGAGRPRLSRRTTPSSDLGDPYPACAILPQLTPLRRRRRSRPALQAATSDNNPEIALRARGILKPTLVIPPPIAAEDEVRRRPLFATAPRPPPPNASPSTSSRSRARRRAGFRANLAPGNRSRTSRRHLQ